MLEEKAKNAKGQWKLLKIDIDKFPKIATQLQVLKTFLNEIKSVPTVILVHKGNGVDGFTGLPDEATFTKFF